MLVFFHFIRVSRLISYLEIALVIPHAAVQVNSAELQLPILPLPALCPQRCAITVDILTRVGKLGGARQSHSYEGKETQGLQEKHNGSLAGVAWDVRGSVCLIYGF